MKKAKKSFGRRVLMTYVLLLVIVSIGFMVEFLQTVTYIFDSNVTYLKQYNAQVNLSLDSILSDEQEFEYLYLLDKKTEEIFTQDLDISEMQMQKNRQYMQDILLMLEKINYYALRITIELDDGRIYSSVDEDVSDYVNQCAERFADVDWTNGTEKYYTDAYECEIDKVNYQIVTCASKIFSMDGSKDIGTIYLDLNWNDIEDKFMETVIQDIDNAFVVLTENSIMLSSKENHIEANGGVIDLLERAEKLISGEKDHMVIYYNDNYYLTTGMENQATGWHVLGYISLNTVLKKSVRHMWGSMLCFVIIIVVAMMAAKMLADQISRPITMLSNVMSSSVDGKVELFTQPNLWDDEVGELIDDYNRMGERLNDTIQRVYIYQLNQKQAELRMLQYQINPHFLYNALSTMSSIARLEEVDYIPEIADSLSNMFRYSIKGKEFVSIDDELKQVDNYLNIMRIRFPEHYIVEYDIKDELRQYGMLKLVIQPLVENAMHHGFVKKRKKDYLKISVCESGMDDIIISIYDDGIGIAEDELQQLNEKLFRMSPDLVVANPNGGLGLSNVNARLKNYYGDDYQLHVESKQGEYTCVSFRIKKMK